jgi:zinc/manganese transport system permease protein
MKTSQKLRLYVKVLTKMRSIAMIDHTHTHELVNHIYTIASLLALCFMLPPLGLFMVARRMSLMGDALSHALLPGVVIAVIVGGRTSLSLTIGAFAAGLLIALFTFLLKKQGVREESSLAAVNIISMSLGAALLPLAGKDLHLEHLLFGSITTLQPFAFWLLIVTQLTVCGLLIVFFKRLIQDTVDPAFAPSKSMPLLFFSLMMVSLIASYQAAGTLLAVGLMLIPALTARVFAKTIKTQVLYAVLVALLCAGLGFIVHELTELEPAPLILLIAGLVYLVALLIKALTLQKPHLKG